MLYTHCQEEFCSLSYRQTTAFYGGTFAHKYIVFEFASAISPVFKLYLIKEFKRLKSEENNREQLEWDAKRFLSKNNLEWLAYAAEECFKRLEEIAKYQLTILNEAEKVRTLPELP